MEVIQLFEKKVCADLAFNVKYLQRPKQKKHFLTQTKLKKNFLVQQYAAKKHVNLLQVPP